MKTRAGAVAVLTTTGLVAGMGVAGAAWQVAGTATGAASATSLGSPSASAAPTTGATDSSITVSWTPNGGLTPAGYRVDRVSPAANVCTVGAAARSCNDIARTASTSYEYRVTALLHDWTSGSGTASATTAAAPVVIKAPSVAIGSVPAQGANYGTNASGTKVNWSHADITGTVTAGAAVSVVMKNVTANRFAQLLPATNAAPDRYTSTTAVKLPAVVTGTTWTLEWDNDQFPLTTASMEITVTATNGASSSTSVVRTFTFTRGN